VSRVHSTPSTLIYAMKLIYDWSLLAG